MEKCQCLIRLIGTRKYIPCLCMSRPQRPKKLMTVLLRCLQQNRCHQSRDDGSLGPRRSYSRYQLRDRPQVGHMIMLLRCPIDSISLHYLIDRIWDDLGLVKVYTKKRGAHPDLADPICMRKGSTIEVPPGKVPRPFTCSHNHISFRMFATVSTDP
jgi:hypothetical protein